MFNCQTGILNQKIFKISTEFKDTFDVRKIVVGKPYAILKSKDTSEIAQFFIYENDKINYTVVDLRDSVAAYTRKKRVKFVERTASGVINSNLSVAIDEQGIDYMVTNNLSEIYAWSIDFFRLQKGDKFKGTALISTLINFSSNSTEVYHLKSI